MNRVKIVTDSTADLSSELLQKYDISVIPLYVLIEDKSYLDGIEMTTEELYRQVERTQKLPKTASPSTGHFQEHFAKWVDEGYDVVYVGLSSKLSGTFQAARLAAEEFEDNRVRVLDTFNLSTGIGILAIKAAELAREGMDAAAICDTLSALVPKVRCSFVIDTMKYLHMGGRCSSMQYLAGSVLKIRPQIIVQDGGMIVGEKFRGKRSSCLNQFYEEVVKDGSNIDPGRVFVTHSGCSQEELNDYKTRLEALGISEVLVTQAGTVISSHCGPGTVGIIYIEK